MEQKQVTARSESSHHLAQSRVAQLNSAGPYRTGARMDQYIKYPFKYTATVCSVVAPTHLAGTIKVRSTTHFCVSVCIHI